MSMEQLDDLVSNYGKIDAQEKALKKQLDADKATIKELLEQSEINEYTAGGYTVKYTTSERVSIDEVKMLSILQRDWIERFGDIPCPYIKTIEVIDEEALESALYKGDIPEDILKELDGCRDVKQVVTLKCGKEKKKKENEDE